MLWFGLTLRGTRAAYSTLFMLAMVSLMACSQEPVPATEQSSPVALSTPTSVYPCRLL